MKTDLIKISILKDNDSFAYMEYQNGNNPLIYNNTYGENGFWDITEVCEAIIKTYKGMDINVVINL